MQEDEKYLTEDSAEKKEDAIMVRAVRMVVWGVVGVVLIFFSATSGCVMYKSQFTAANTAANTEYLRAQNEVEVAQNEAIIKLIEKGTNPIAARCAIIGKEGNSDLCAVFVTIDDKQGDELR